MNLYGLKDFVPPIAGKYRITSGEGKRVSRRTTNGNRMSSFHYGTDWAGEVPGSKPDIQNITAGKVVWAGKAGGWGNAVIVENPDGYRVQYGHLDSINVKVGDQVPAGGKIGVMGSTGNVTGVHLDLIVTKDGKALKRDGSVLADAPSSIAKRAGGKQPPSAPTAPPVNVPLMTAGAPPEDNVDSTTLSPNVDTDMFATAPLTKPDRETNLLAILQGSVGLVIPDTPTQNKMFSKIADMGLGSDLESIYAIASKAIANAKDSVVNKPMIQSEDPLREEIGALFDKIEV